MRRGNIVSGFEDNITLSNTFLGKYAKMASTTKSPIETTVSKTPVAKESAIVKRIASKEEPAKLGFISQGTGLKFYKSW